MNLALVFSGQGSQFNGMGQDLYLEYPEVKKIYDSYPEIKDISFTPDDSRIHETEYTQQCIVLYNLAIAEVLKNRGVKVRACLGLSLGEYSALCFSDGLSLEDTLDLVKIRGELMAQGLKDTNTSMMAVMHNDLETIREIAEREEVEIANYNAPSQYVLTGDKDSLEVVRTKLKEAGIKRCIPLKVSGAFHSKYLKETSLKFKDILSNYTFSTPSIPVIHNTIADISEDFVPLLSQHLYSSVRFSDSITTLKKQGIDACIEIGGKGLSKLIQEQEPTIKVYSIKDVSDLRTCLKEIQHD